MVHELVENVHVPGEDLSAPASLVTSISCQTYERLLAGEMVSWIQILREHPLLGSVTVTQLVNAGVVEVTPDYDPSTGATDFYLSLRQARPKLRTNATPS